MTVSVPEPTSSFIVATRTGKFLNRNGQCMVQLDPETIVPLGVAYNAFKDLFTGAAPHDGPGIRKLAASAEQPQGAVSSLQAGPRG